MSPTPLHSSRRQHGPDVTFTAAHLGFPAALPLGGGATIARWLLQEWERNPPFDFIALGPGPDRGSSPLYHQITINPALLSLTALTERQYATLCSQFERATTDFILRHSRPHSWVLSNDVSEGPEFPRLVQAGFSVATIFHVDVVDYFCRFYLRGTNPRVAARWYEKMRRRGLHRLVPAILRLVFEKQRQAVTHSRRLIVPSRPMKDVLHECYPETPARIEVVPWGGIEEAPGTSDAVRAAATDLRARLAIADGDTVLITLGRLSPEKGIELLLRSLLWLEANVLMAGSDTTVDSTRLRVLICGEPAYMRGERYRAALTRLARQLRHIRADFLGHVTGSQKAAALSLADLFVHPSVHESYGLTIVEAMRAGLPVLTTDHYSASDLVGEESGVVVRLDVQRRGVRCAKDLAPLKYSHAHFTK